MGLALLGTSIEPLQHKVPRGFVGQAEMQVFRFKALSEGEAALRFTKGRVWEKRAPEAELRVLLSVSAS